MKTKLIISGLAFLSITAMAGAQNSEAPSRQRNSTQKGIAFVDSNKNGICDNYENPASATAQQRRQGSGKYCGMGQRHGQGKGLSGKGQVQGRGQGRRTNFIDADNNGICDNYEVPAKK